MKVFIIILLILILIGFINLKVSFIFNEKIGFRFFLKIFFLKFNIYPKKKEAKDYEKKVTKKKVKKEKKNIFENIKMVKILVKSLPSLLQTLNKGFKITNIRFYVDVAREQAFETAILYVKFFNIIYFVFCFIKRFCKVKKSCFNIKPNFLIETSKYDILINMKVSIGRIFIATFKYIIVVFFGLVKANSNKK